MHHAQHTPLRGRFPGRELVGGAVPPGMITLAGQRTASLPAARAVVQDAAVLDPAWSQACAAVVSVFGPQQLPIPDEAIAGWVRALSDEVVAFEMVHADAAAVWEAMTTAASQGRCAPWPGVAARSFRR
ncbi:hypothetical protein [Streptomyces sp. NPDC088812]|uniref:hypothetical protein n=1 Tax=Streptomyces sp. NPDC088812 TaxID=3365905 RepID=UPI003820CAAF